MVGSGVGRIKAHDLDIGKNAEVEYNIVPGDGGNMFDITTNEHNQEGIIMLKKVRLTTSEQHAPIQYICLINSNIKHLCMHAPL